MLKKALSDFRFVAALSAVIHICLIAYGHWQDTHLRVKYTDIDYMVYTDAARAVYRGGSPFERHTYRYTPLLAWLLVPNISVHITFGKVLFSLCDMAIGFMLYRMLKDAGKSPSTASKLSATWLLSPITLNVSTRGNADSLICLMVVATLYHIQRGEWIRSALWFGLSVHMKIFPVIYAIPLVMYLNPDFLAFSRVDLLKAIKLNSKQIWYTVISAGLFFLLLAVLYCVYGWEFLYETYLYHFVRIDHRHNFSIFFYLMYLSAETPSIALSVVTFIPQWVAVLAVGCGFSRISLNMGSFLQTLLFVAFNKVCTAQYFVWYLALLPLALGQLKPTVSKTWLLALGVLWLSTEGLWLFFAYELEFEGKNTFIELFGASTLFFAAHIAIACTFIANYDWHVSAVNDDHRKGAAPKMKMGNKAKESKKCK